MRISIALCTYNGAAYLPAQLKSLEQQEQLPFELIVCDDRSTDATWQILEDFARNAPFAVHLRRNSENLGSTRNFEQAMQLCGGDAIAFCDQDDIWYPQKLRVLSSQFTSEKVLGVFSDGDLLREGSHLAGSLWQTFGLVGSELEKFQHLDPFGVMLRTNRVTGMTLIMRREAIPLVLPLPTCWIHDYWIGMLLILYGKLVACPERLVGYRIHGAQQLSIPNRFLSELNRRGVKAVFGELSGIAQRDSSTALIQIQELLKRLQEDKTHSEISAAISRLNQLEKYLQRRSRIRQWGVLQRIWAVAANWRSYDQFAPRATRDRLVDLLAIPPHPMQKSRIKH